VAFPGPCRGVGEGLKRRESAMERELRSATMGEDGVREGGSWLVLAEVTRWEKQQASSPVRRL
jgi:hypothetical protein